MLSSKAFYKSYEDLIFQLNKQKKKLNISFSARDNLKNEIYEDENFLITPLFSK